MLTNILVNGLRQSSKATRFVCAVAGAHPILTVGLVGVATATAVVSLRPDIRDMLISLGATAMAQPPDIQPAIVRGQFNDCSLLPTRADKNHTHGESARLRSAAPAAADVIGHKLNRGVFHIQMSASDQRKGRTGSRIVYWAKDMQAEQRLAKPKEGGIVMITDTDYYLDMEKLLCECACPTLIYTAQPGAVAAVCGDYCFTFDAENQLNWRVTGGATYRHKVYNYAVDTILVQKRFLGIPYRSVSYVLSRKRVDDHHQFICAAPLCSWGFIGSLFSALLGADHLERLEPSDGKYLRMLTISKGGCLQSTGRAGSYAVATIPSQVDEAIAVAARTSGTRLSAPTVHSFLTDYYPDRSKREVAVAALLEYHLEHAAQERKGPIVFPLEEAVKHFDYDVRNTARSTKPTLVAFMAPLMNGAYAPVLGKGNEEECVTGRITEQIAKNKVTMTRLTMQIICEFVDRVVPKDDVGTLHPTDVEEVELRQNRPSQRSILSAAEFMRPRRIIKMFIKKEPYNEPKPPRPISQINGVDKRDYSRFTYALSAYVKNLSWYAFGKTPINIARAVADVCSGAEYVTPSDFSRFDGSVKTVVRCVEQMVLTRAFHRSYTGEVVELHNSQSFLNAVGTFGTKYEQNATRASGSPETAVMNSIVNAFAAFYTIRRMGVPADIAYARLGLYGGDDGLTADVPPEKYVQYTKEIGLTVKASRILRGDFGVTFLARVYGPDVFYGDINSCCDLPRQLSKLHVTPHLPPHVTPVDKLREKVMSYMLTDSITPVLGDFVRVASGLIPQATSSDAARTVRSWWAEQYPDAINQYPNNRCFWMNHYAMHSLPGFDFDAYRDWLLTVRSAEDLLKAPSFIDLPDPEVKKPVVVNERVLYPRGATGAAQAAPRPPCSDKQAGPAQAPPRPPRPDLQALALPPRHRQMPKREKPRASDHEDPKQARRSPPVKSHHAVRK